MSSKVRKPWFLVGALLLLGGVLSTSGVMAQELSGADVSGALGDTVEVDLDWESAGDISSITVEINYDDSVLDADVTNCLGSLQDPHASDPFSNCIILNPGQLSITIGDVGAAELETHTFGSVAFTIDPSATVGNTYPIQFTIHGALDLNRDDLPDLSVISTDDGSITILAGPQSELDVDPDSHNFGTVDLGNLPQTQVFTATNNGDAGSTLEISAITQSGDSEIDLTANDNCTGVTLNAGDTCDFEVEFNATANGTYSADFEVVSDADSNAIITVNVAGEADSVADFDVTFSGGLGSGNPGDTLTETGLIENNGSADGDVSCSLTGDAEISIDPDPFSVTIPAGESASFDVICEIPSSASEGDSYNSTLTCEEVGGTVIYGDDIGCSVRAAAPAVPVPTMQSWGIALFSLIMLAIGGLSIRAFRS